MNWSGAVDILVNNAGMAQTGLSLGVESSRRASCDCETPGQLPCTRRFCVTRATIADHAETGIRRIVNVSSVTGPLVSNIGSGAYGARGRNGPG